jgi:cytochrome c oxidase assembly protein subunit 15
MVAIPVPEAEEGRPGIAGLRAVRAWLLTLLLLVFAMVLVGGATRLTQSGLSITEWNLVMGAIPPLSDAAWREAYDLYRQSPQYELLNQGMSLADFKTIFWWEWAHRELGRFIGLVYIAGFLWIALRRAVSARTLALLAATGLLLGMQGLVGWIMVASGLEPGMTAVAPLKLMLHLVLACLFFAALVLTFIRLGGAEREAAAAATRRLGWALVALAFVQVALGGLVAGHDAGLTYNTWPLMDGRFIPPGLAMLEPLWLNLADNVATIQFNHRLGAYLLSAAVLAYAFAVRRESRPARHRALLLSALVLGQLALGIATLVQVVPIGLALAHQGTALILLLALVWNASVFTGPRTTPR